MLFSKLESFICIAKLKVLPAEYLLQTTWGGIKEKFKEVGVLAPNQDFEQPMK